MIKILSILLLSFILSLDVHAKGTKIHCKFISGEKVSPGKQKTIYKKGDLLDVYLEIDFDREKVIESPFNVYGLFGSKTQILFDGAKVSWTGKNKYVQKVAILNRQDGSLIEVYNLLDDSRESGERNYLCSKSKLKF